MCAEQNRNSSWFQELLDARRDDPEANAYSWLYRLSDDVCATMEENGMTKEELAEKASLSMHTVGRFCNTDTRLSLLTIFRIVKASGMAMPSYMREEE